MTLQHRDTMTLQHRDTVALRHRDIVALRHSDITARGQGCMPDVAQTLRGVSSWRGGHNERIFALAYDPSTSRVISGSRDCKVPPPVLSLRTCSSRHCPPLFLSQSRASLQTRCVAEFRTLCRGGPTPGPVELSHERIHICCYFSNKVHMAMWGSRLAGSKNQGF
jgi:hypothetical protein